MCGFILFYLLFFVPFSSLPKWLFSLRYLSLFFLGCETVTTLFWNDIKSIRKFIRFNFTCLQCLDSHFNFPFLACIDVANCLDNGKSVLFKYGFVSENFSFDLIVLLVISFLAIVFGYFGILRRMKKQPAY